VPHGAGGRAFREIDTAARVDHPQHAWVIGPADNGDGTLSLLTTLVEGDAPCAADYDDRTPRGLASPAGEPAFDDPHADPGAVGAPTDRNAEPVVAGRSPALA